MIPKAEKVATTTSILKMSDADETDVKWLICQRKIYVVHTNNCSETIKESWNVTISEFTEDYLQSSESMLDILIDELALILARNEQMSSSSMKKNLRKIYEDLHTHRPNKL